jgi:hypothetical protein
MQCGAGSNLSDNNLPANLPAVLVTYNEKGFIIGALYVSR